MQSAAEFWAPRACFLPPIPELEEAIDLISAAADALVAGDHGLAHSLAFKADIPAVNRTAWKIMDTVNADIHRFRKIKRSAPPERAKSRMPSEAEKSSIFARDGWRCRFCGVRVLCPKARKVMAALLPDAICWTGPSQDHHAAFYAASATLDHVLPHSLGGSNDPSNLVTTCWPCNFGRGGYHIGEAGLIDPFSRDPITDEWDGLTRLLRRSPKKPQAVAHARIKPSITPSNTEWFAKLDRVGAGVSGRLLAFLEDCKSLHVTWGLRKVLVIRLNVDGNLMYIFGVEPNGDVCIPWMIRGQKAHSCDFAHRVADAIPGAAAHESTKMWNVSKPGAGKVNVLEFLEAGAMIKLAIEEFYYAVGDTKQIT